MKDDKGAPSYFETLRDQTEQYAQNLLRENEKLRALALAVEAENTRLQGEVAAAREMVSEARIVSEAFDGVVREKAQLQVRLQETTGELEAIRAEGTYVAEKLAATERDSRGIADQYATVMRQNSSLANLYVSSHMLHSSLDRADVLSGIAQIIINIVGSEDFAVYEKQGDDLIVATSSGESTARLHAAEPGAGVIVSLAEQARVCIFDHGAGTNGLTAFIPLAIGNYVIGAIAIFRLLPQKPSIHEGDGEIFEMLSTHASTALHCASLHERYGRERSTSEQAVHS